MSLRGCVNIITVLRYYQTRLESSEPLNIITIMFIIIQYKENYYKKIQKLLINKLVELLNLKKTKMN